MADTCISKCRGSLLGFMPGKKKDPNALLQVPDDTYNRARKLCDLKVAIKPPKQGCDLTAEEWSIPPALHSMHEFRQVIGYWKKCCTVQYVERKDLKTASRIKDVEDLEKKSRVCKEIMELFKFMKTTVKQSDKRTGQFLKQLQKKRKERGQEAGIGQANREF